MLKIESFLKSSINLKYYFWNLFQYLHKLRNRFVSVRHNHTSERTQATPHEVQSIFVSTLIATNNPEQALLRLPDLYENTEIIAQWKCIEAYF